MPSRERSGEAVSQPIEHSPGPWVESDYDYTEHNGGKVTGWCIRDAHGARVVECHSEYVEPSKPDGKLLAAAPTMYRVLRQICNEDWQCREQGLRSAQFLLRELEGGTDAEA
jgi:hypothetical protein